MPGNVIRNKKRASLGRGRSRGKVSVPAEGGSWRSEEPRVEFEIEKIEVQWGWRSGVGPVQVRWCSRECLSASLRESLGGGEA